MVLLRKIGLSLAIIVFLISCEDSQSDTDTLIIEPILGEVDWLKTFGGSDDETARAVIETADGGLAVLGYTKSTDGDVIGKNTPVNDFWLLKLDNEGTVQWQQTYGGSDDDRGRDIIQTLDGGYAIAGYSKSSDGDASNNEGQHDNWILKLDATGSVQWEKSFGFSGHDHLYSILQTNDGGYFLGGFLDVTESNGEGSTGKKGISTSHGVGEFWGQKLDSNGNLEWRRYFGGTNNDRIHKVLQANDSGFVLVGFTESNDFDITQTNGSYDFWVVKIDNNGEMVWQKTFGGSGLDIAYGAANSHDNAYVIAGQTISTDGDITNSKGESDFWVIKVNDSGDLVWQKTFGGSDFDAAWSISPSADKGFIIAGNSKSVDNDVASNHGENDFWIIKINQNGTLLNEVNTGGSTLDFAYGITETSDGKIVAVGDTDSNDQDITGNQGKKDVMIVKIK
ncbi:hypothetical protein [Spongiivirga citrea]|uniref:T9SS C-terminal target domain-containing protein n=1 Tax=Spongiivirga citrea TaxID=1481457 RepID=A0A6M0CGJ9_9FLAO|nr:hypothetical protein [Spongiivirga citrea]NER17038.1 hypothetical protein [Spongiivirga citrea]